VPSTSRPDAPEDAARLGAALARRVEHLFGLQRDLDEMRCHLMQSLADVDPGLAPQRRPRQTPRLQVAELGVALPAGDAEEREQPARVTGPAVGVLRLGRAEPIAGQAVRRYRDLRGRYYGSEAYDFRELPLVELARTEARAGRSDNAIGLLQLSAEFFPNSGMTPAARGDVYLEKGDTARALASYREALAKDSTMGMARARIQQLNARPRPGP